MQDLFFLWNGNNSSLFSHKKLIFNFFCFKLNDILFLKNTVIIEIIILSSRVCVLLVLRLTRKVVI